jgi:hypothetical protein
MGERRWVVRQRGRDERLEAFSLKLFNEKRRGMEGV